MQALRVRYQTIEFGEVDIHVRVLRDKQQFLDTDGIAEKLGISSATWPLFGIVWPSSQVMAHFLMDFQVNNKRILEVGCGIGLTSLILNHRLADISATDYHPEAEAFLEKNVALNEGKKIPFFRTGWADDDNGMGRFDLVLGSDILYEPEHVELLANFIEQHASPACEVIIVDPGRGYKAKFSKRMKTLGYACIQSTPADMSYLEKPFKGHILQYTREKTI